MVLSWAGGSSCMCGGQRASHERSPAGLICRGDCFHTRSCGGSSAGGGMTEPVRARRLTDQGGQRLLQIVRWGKHEPVRVRGAVIIVASASGTGGPAIARLVVAGEDTVRDVIHGFNAKGAGGAGPSVGGRPSRPDQRRGHRGHRRGGHHRAGEAGTASHPVEPAQAGGLFSLPSGRAGDDRAGAAAADRA